MSGSSLGRRAASGAAWVTLEMASVQVLSLLVFAVLARFLDPHGFGLAAMALMLVNGCKLVLVDAAALVVARKSAGTDAEYATASWITIGLAAAAWLGLQGFSLVADGLFGAAGLGAVLRGMSAVLLVQGMGRTQEVWMQRHFRYRALATRSIVGALAGGVLGLVCARAGWGVWAIVVQQVGTALVGAGLLWRACPWRPGARFCRRAARDIAGFYWGMAGGNLAYAFDQCCDTLLVGLAFGPAQAGLYSVAKRLRLALQLTAATPVKAVTGPALAEVQDDPARFARVLGVAATVAASVCAPVFLGAAAVGGDVIALLFGAQWAPAAAVFAWLAVGALPVLVLEFNNAAFLIRGRPGWTFGLALLTTAATLAGVAACSGVAGVPTALPFVLPPLLAVPVSLALLGRLTGFGAAGWGRAAWPGLLAAGAMVAVLRQAEPWLAGVPAAVRLGCLVGGGAALYLVLLAMLSRSLLRDVLLLVRGRRTVLP